MRKRKGLFNRLVAAIIASRFAPIEFVLAFSGIVHGLWLIYIGQTMDTSLTTVTSIARNGEILYSFYMILTGALVLVSARVELPSGRRNANLAMFVGWIFTALLAFAATGVTGILWIAYSTIAFVSAMVYLNVSIGVHGGDG